MNVRSITDDEVHNAAQKAQDIARELNKMLRTHSLAHLMTMNKISAIYHPYVVNGDLGPAYKQGYEKWAPGALTHLCSMYEDANGPKFGAGSFGSVWFDVDLTSDGKTKKVRVTYYGKQANTHLIMLDATFDETW